MSEKVCFSEAQLRAVMHGTGPMLVSAGPGSGKTAVLTGRILRMLQTRLAEPEEIMVITFTRDAARSMADRFRNLCRERGMEQAASGKVHFATFHSFYYQILRSHLSYQDFQLIHEESQVKLIQYLLESCFYKGDAAILRQMAESLHQAIGFYKNTMDEEAYIRKLPEECREKGPEWFRSYQREMERRKWLDMDDLIYRTRELLEEPMFRLRWQGIFSHYLIDEFQDCNPLQYICLKILAQHGKSLFAVGDEDQSIYGFRGAQPEIMQLFLQDFPNAEQVFLGENYRSYPAIVDFAGRIMEHTAGRREKHFVSMVPPELSKDGGVERRGFANRREEWDFLYAMLQSEGKREQNGTAILFRTNLLLRAFTAGLQRHHIPYTDDRQQSIYEHFAVRDMMAYLRAGAGEKSREIFLRILNAPRIGVGRESLSRERVDLEELKRFYECGVYANPQTVRNIELLQRRLLQLQKLPLPLAVKFVRRAFGYEEFLKKRLQNQGVILEQALFVLDLLEQEAETTENLKEWLELQSRCIREAANAKQKRSGEGVRVMTIHAAKGLEFDRVLIPDVNEGNIPRLEKHGVTPKEQIEEEKRLFYVAATRARKKLVLTYVDRTKEQPSFPSRFLKNYSSSPMESNS